MNDNLISNIKEKVWEFSFYCSDIDNNAIDLDTLWEIVEQETNN